MFIHEDVPKQTDTQTDTEADRLYGGRLFDICLTSSAEMVGTAAQRSAASRLIAADCRVGFV